jgi:hypothetical protein
VARLAMNAINAMKSIDIQTVIRTTLGAVVLATGAIEAAAGHQASMRPEGCWRINKKCYYFIYIKAEELTDKGK